MPLSTCSATTSVRSTVELPPAPSFATSDTWCSPAGAFGGMSTSSVGRSAVVGFGGDLVDHEPTAAERGLPPILETLHIQVDRLRSCGDDRQIELHGRARLRLHCGERRRDHEGGVGVCHSGRCETGEDGGQCSAREACAWWHGHGHGDQDGGRPTSGP